MSEFAIGSVYRPQLLQGLVDAQEIQKRNEMDEWLKQLTKQLDMFEEKRGSAEDRKKKLTKLLKKGRENLGPGTGWATARSQIEKLRPEVRPSVLRESGMHFDKVPHTARSREGGKGGLKSYLQESIEQQGSESFPFGVLSNLPMSIIEMLRTRGTPPRAF